LANIIILDEFTANQIAAGEVVERPVSVVKELVENSLDAGAGRIMVDLEDGGLGTITVTDNGCGMVEEDLLLAFHRHATSKIRYASDLGRVTTLGFRGEALPSIAAVARVSVITRTPEALSGVGADLEAGSPVSPAPVGCPPGTTITVRDLFYNTPARKKAMKSPSTEGALCGDMISRLALARPGVSFELRTKGKRVFYSPGTGRLLDSITAVYGVQQGREMVAVNTTDGDLQINGFAGKPSLSRSTRGHITVIINGRYVRCPVVAGAVEEAYHTLLPRGRRPVAIISLTVPPCLLDVNVHPAKFEVRLLDEERVAGLVTKTLRAALRVRTVIPATLADGRKWNAPARSHAQVALGLTPESPEAVTGEFLHKLPWEIGSATNDVEQKTGGNREKSCGLQPEKNRGVGTACESSVDYHAAKRSLPALNALAQLPPTYILAVGGNGLYIIDQHAAHERILYEEFLAVDEKRPSQYLLVPATLELDHREAAILTDHVLWFTDAGFVIEHFGGNTFLLRGIPHQFPVGREKEIFLDILDYFRERGPGANRVEFFDRLASSMACRSAVKAGERLSPSAMDALLQRLARTENPHTCPHGRPTVIHLSYRDLETRFKR